MRGLAGVLWALALSTATLLCGQPLSFAEELAGVPLNRKVPVALGDDLGFGKKYRLSMARNFQDWGAQSVAKSDGHPVRLGGQSIRFETREGFCGSDEGWSDCKNGRSRHELSGAVYDHDPWNADRWYALSLYIPKGFGTPSNIKTSIFQFWAGGKDSWMFKYERYRGFLVQRKLDHNEKVIVWDNATLDRWNDYVLRVRHSLKGDGLLTVWANGELVYDYKGRTAAGDNPKRKPYFKFGIYNTAMGPNGAPIDGGGYGNGKGLPDLVLYFDEVRYAKSCEGLNLADLGYDCAGLSQ
jgi:hypothetical protein